MKLPRIKLKVGIAKKKQMNRFEYADYYQKNLNSFGREQMETLIKKGLSLSW